MNLKTQKIVKRFYVNSRVTFLCLVGIKVYESESCLGLYLALQKYDTDEIENIQQHLIPELMRRKRQRT